MVHIFHKYFEIVHDFARLEAQVKTRKKVFVTLRKIIQYIKSFESKHEKVYDSKQSSCIISDEKI